MILRKPTFQDIYRSLTLLSEDENDQKVALQQWLNEQKTDYFFSWVIVKEHNVLAVVIGWNDDKQNTVIIGKLKTAEKHNYLKQKLFDKILREFDPEVIKFTTNEDGGEFLANNNFVAESWNMVWNKPTEEENEDITVEDTDENNQSPETTDSN